MYIFKLIRQFKAATGRSPTPNELSKLKQQAEAIVEQEKIIQFPNKMEFPPKKSLKEFTEAEDAYEQRVKEFIAENDYANDLTSFDLETEMLKRMNRQNKESVERLKKKKEKDLGDKLKDYDGDPDAMAMGGRAGFNVGGIAKLLKMLQGKVGKKNITTADKIGRPKSALDREMFDEANKRFNKKVNERTSNKSLLKAMDEVGGNFTGDLKYDADVLADEIAFQRGLIPEGGDVTDIADQRKRMDLYDEAYSALSQQFLKNREQLKKMQQFSKPTQTLKSIKEKGAIDISDPTIADEFTTFLKENDPKGYKNLEQKIQLDTFDTKGRKKNATGGMARVGYGIGGLAKVYQLLKGVNKTKPLKGLEEKLIKQYKSEGMEFIEAIKKAQIEAAGIRYESKIKIIDDAMKDTNVYSDDYVDLLDIKIKLEDPDFAKDYMNFSETLKNKTRAQTDEVWAEANFGENYSEQMDIARSKEINESIDPNFKEPLSPSNQMASDIDDMNKANIDEIIGGRKKNAVGGLAYMLGEEPRSEYGGGGLAGAPPVTYDDNIDNIGPGPTMPPNTMMDTPTIDPKMFNQGTGTGIMIDQRRLQEGKIPQPTTQGLAEGGRIGYAEGTEEPLEPINIGIGTFNPQRVVDLYEKAKNIPKNISLEDISLEDIKGIPKRLMEGTKSSISSMVEPLGNEYRAYMEFFSLPKKDKKKMEEMGLGIFDVFEYLAMRDNKAQGGRIGFKNGGMDRRGFLKLMGGLAALPFVGKFFKGAKVASKVVPLKGTTTTMPTWFPDLVDKFVAKGVGKKIDEDLMEYTTKELPGVKMAKSDNGKIIVEGKNEYGRPYAIEYEPPGYEVIDEVKGKAVKTRGDFRATDVVPESGGRPDDVPDFFPEQLDSVDDILSSDARVMEEFATGSKVKGIKKGESSLLQAEQRLDNSLNDIDEFASGGLAKLLGE